LPIFPSIFLAEVIKTILKRADVRIERSISMGRPPPMRGFGMPGDERVCVVVAGRARRMQF